MEKNNSKYIRKYYLSPSLLDNILMKIQKVKKLLLKYKKNLVL